MKRSEKSAGESSLLVVNYFIAALFSFFLRLLPLRRLHLFDLDTTGEICQSKRVSFYGYSRLEWGKMIKLGDSHGLTRLDN